MPNFFDKQKFKSTLMSRGITMSDDEINTYLESSDLGGKPKSYLPYKNQMLNQDTGYQKASLEQEYIEPVPPENALVDFLGNTLWEALDVGSFGALGALDYNDYLENIVTTGGPTTFAGRVGAGLGGLAGFIGPMGIMKGAAGSIIKGSSKYGTTAAANQMVKDGAKALSRTKYSKISGAEQAAIWKPFKDQLGQYGHALENTAMREKFVKKLNENIRPAIVKQLKDAKINPSTNTITKMEEIIKSSMGTLSNSRMPIWNLQQRIAIMLGGGSGAGKLASLASHSLEEAAIFAAVEVPMELFNSVDEFRDPDLPGTIAHAVTLGSVLGMVRMIPGGSDMPIMRAGWDKLKQSFGKKTPYLNLDYGTKEAREAVGKSALQMFNKNPKIFNIALGDKALKKLGFDQITSPSQIRKLSETQHGAEKLAEALSMYEKNYAQKWLPEFMKSAGQDIWGSIPRMFAGSMAFNYEIMFDDNIPLEDKVFNIAVGAYMTKRGKALEFTGPDGKLHVVESHANRPWSHNPELIKINEYLQILNTPSPNLLFDSIVQEQELRSKYIGVDQTDDVKAVFKVLEDSGVIVADSESKKIHKKPENPADHEVYDLINAISGFYVNVDNGKRMLDVSELSRKQLTDIEKKLSKIELTSTRGEGGIVTVSDMTDVLVKANEARTTEVIDLYKSAIVDMYKTVSDGTTNIDWSDPVVVNFSQTDMARLGPEAQKALTKIIAVRDLLSQYGDVKKGKSTNPDLTQSIDTTEAGQAKIIETITRLEEQLHEIVYKDHALVNEDFKVELGDEFVENVIRVNRMHKNIRDSHDKLMDLDNQNGTWGNSPEQAKKINTAIGKIFATELGLHQKVVVESFGKKTPEDLGLMQEFANTILEILPYSSKYTTPINFEEFGKGAKGVSYADVKELKRLLYSNGMGGFAFTGKDLELYINEFKGYSMDRKLSSATRIDGEALSGIDRSIINSLVRTGLVNQNMETIGTIKVLERLNMVVGKGKLLDFEQMKELGHGKKLIIDSEIIDVLFEKSAIELRSPEGEELRKMILNLSKEAEKQGIDLSDYVNRLNKKYEDYIRPYIRDGKGNGFLTIRTDVDATADLLNITTIEGMLSTIQSTEMKARHSELMATIEHYSTSEHGKHVQEVMSVLRNNFWNRQGDTAKVIALLGRYGHTDENGEFVPIYDANKNKFNVEFEGSVEKLKETLRALEMYIPSTQRSEQVKQRMRELLREPLFPSDAHSTVTPQSYLEKYHLPIDKDQLITKIDPNINLSSKAYESLKNDASIIRDGETTRVSFDDMTSFEKSEFIDQTARLILTTGTSRQIKKLVVGERAGVWTDWDNSATDNPMFRMLDDLVGVGNYSIVSRDVELGTGLSDSRTDANAMNVLINRLAEGGATQDINMRANEFEPITRAEALNEFVFVNVGDYSWGLAIPKNKLNDVYNTFGKFISSKKSKLKSSKYKRVLNILKKLYDTKGEDVVQDDGSTIKLFKSSDAPGNSEMMETMFTMMWMDKMAGKVWWDHLSETAGKNNREASASVAKWSKRIRLMSNISSKELSSSYVKSIVDIHSKEGVISNSTIKDMKELNDNKGISTVLVNDEGANSELFSTLEGVRKQINDEARRAQNTLVQDDIHNKALRTSDSDRSRADASIADSVMLMPVKYFKALQAISGYHSMGNIGGIKPIISGVGDALLLGKTAILPDTRFQEFFDNNKGVHAILMDSGAKIKNSNIKVVDPSGMDMNTLKKHIVNRDEIQHIPWESINIGAAVKSDYNATMSYQTANELDSGLSNSFYDWLIDPNMKNYEKQMGKFMDHHNSIGTVAFARRLVDGGTGDNASLSLMDYWVNSANGGAPISFTGVMPAFKNSIKSKFLDNGILQIHNEHGGQSVMSPFLGQSWKDLRNTTFHVENGERTVYTYGQAQIANINRHKKVPLNRLNIIEHNTDGADKIISFNELKGLPRMQTAISRVFAGKTKIPVGATLEQVNNVIHEYTKGHSSKHEIAVVFHRTPSTRPSDKIIVGLKGFTKKVEGNQARLNAYDVYARAEADFDIDKINYWWDTPGDILNRWSQNSGKVGMVSEENPAMKTTLDSNYDWTDAKSMRALSGDIAHSEKMRGVVVKAQRIVQFLNEYNSNAKDRKGLIVNMSGSKTLKDNDERIVMDQSARADNEQKLAEDIQRIIDSHGGYNKELYGDMRKWMGEFMFGNKSRYKGLFQIQKYNKDTRSWDNVDRPAAGEEYLSELQKMIMLEIIAPYRSMLQAGSQMWDSGAPKSPRYDDLITTIHTYDNAMKGLNKRIHQRLGWKIERGTDLSRDMEKVFKNNEVLTGDFGNHASTFRDDGNVGKLPFERMLAAIAKADSMSQDAPKSLWGGDLARFETTYQKLLHVGEDADVKQDVLKQLNNDIKKDIKGLNVINYFRWRLSKQQDLERNARRDGNVNFAERIQEDIVKISGELRELEAKIVNSPETIAFIKGVAQKRIENEIRTSPARNKWRGGFKSLEQANQWINNNQSAIKKMASKSPIKYRGINSPEYRDLVIFNEILGKYEHVFIDPTSMGGERMIEFEQSVQDFRSSYKKLWSQFFKDKKRREKWQPWWNETRIMNTLSNEFNTAFDSWEKTTPGLGRLFLWKVMRPRTKVGEFTFFNGKLSEAFNDSDISFVKFGLRFMATADKARIPEFQKKQFFDIITSQYTDWHDFMHNNKLQGSEGMTYRQMYDFSLKELYANSNPLLDGDMNRRSETQQEVYNPVLHNVFGVDNGYSYGFLRDPSSAGTMKEIADNRTFPRGFIPIHYRGGEHPRITGWNDFNNARRGEANVMLGETLSRKVLTFRQQPIVKDTFNGVASKGESFSDLKVTVDQKVQHNENSWTPDC